MDWVYGPNGILTKTTITRCKLGGRTGDWVVWPFQPKICSTTPYTSGISCLSALCIVQGGSFLGIEHREPVRNYKSLRAMRDADAVVSAPSTRFVWCLNYCFSSMSVFADLNVSYTSDVKRLQSILETAAHLGYSTVAINHIADFQEKKKEIDKPVCPSELFPSLPIVQGKSKPIKVVTRLTLITSDPSHCNVLRSTSPRTKLYDIVAVFPKTEKLFHAACTSLDVDLICISVTEKQPFYFRRPPINAAIERGIFFELVYTPSIKDSTMRRYTISNALSLMQICKGKNVIMSSSAERPLELRGPYDVATLGLLFGLSEADAKAAVSSNCRAALLHGETRKTAFGIVYTMKKHQVTVTEEKETVPVCKKAKTEET
ncbi:ribonuclease P protein subunit p30 [Microcaecilia unicolor]|uniref:Ribonuclease P protein subunit p30 n=1 Tax=Microcaecilia unicolor TaxID=1415580 RepID=A0A6P7Y6R8_9AMPH|nr:ribonuclease P protein subunit p30 [Microcaecilia unicolor]